MAAQVSLSDVAERARLIYIGYPFAAADLRRAQEGLSDLRGNAVFCEKDLKTWRDGIDRLERQAAAATTRCEQYRQQLDRLARELPQVLPDLWPRLQLIEQGARWHELVNFDWHTALEELRRIEAAAATGQTTGGAENPPVSKESLALATLAEHPDWSDAKIAQEIGCSRTTLYRWPRFRKARAILREGKRRLPSGTKDKDGNMEAWK
jgi:hypothetical protein